MIHWYTNNVEEHTFEETNVPEGYVRGRLKSVAEKQKRTELSKPKSQRQEEYSKRAKTNREAHHTRTQETREKMREAKIGVKPWSTGLTKETDPRVKALAESTRNGMLNYISKKRVEDPTFYIRWRKSMRDKMHQNGTARSSKPEDELYETLCKTYGTDDVERHYFDANRYPFECDFHIKSIDKFIELNYHPSHGEKPFNPSDIMDVEKKQRLIEDSSRWSKMILDVWANRDVKKLQCAKQNKLNYTVIYRNYSFSLQ